MSNRLRQIRRPIPGTKFTLSLSGEVFDSEGKIVPANGRGYNLDGVRFGKFALLERVFGRTYRAIPAEKVVELRNYADANPRASMRSVAIACGLGADRAGYVNMIVQGRARADAGGPIRRGYVGARSGQQAKLEAMGFRRVGARSYVPTTQVLTGASAMRLVRGGLTSAL